MRVRVDEPVELVLREDGSEVRRHVADHAHLEPAPPHRLECRARVRERNPRLRVHDPLVQRVRHAGDDTVEPSEKIGPDATMRLGREIPPLRDLLHRLAHCPYLIPHLARS